MSNIINILKMQTERDCGPIAIANYLGFHRKDVDPWMYYQGILNMHDFPNKNNMIDDLWDNPWRHREVMADFKNQLEGVSPNASVVLMVRKGSWGLMWHWVVEFKDPHTWWDGFKFQTSDEMYDRFYEVTRYDHENLPWAPWWVIWYYLTLPLLKVFG